ncbi:MucR family transcriptional regulator [Oecophyllibacter saccharovorans]|uniref:MucR family transcriptional regulator n=1 Tax=Oecophyllibacter saccharovorans TaxID=2558360 RepID=A0A506UR03_9PROT|nr:MucR family transcriptional regulator [Oecophyllibacter saccharovorans]QDH14649.1 MucR family transcriptional regulator [Oecophyllibacter saccharovorans]TPW34850.1 MucR family transcriptional regulator [Oecophyllibacter saccharovorans]TPW35787.1 MucR family transcriptional regulator [Oecophyllibacter saccharovorans]
MPDQAENNVPQLLRLTTEIVVAKISGSPISAEALPALIRNVYGALAGQPAEGESSRAETRQQPAVPIRKSVFPDYIICLEDGKKLKMLKRHLKSTYGMTPEQYREKWGLPVDYPLVAPNYAKRRSALAREIGLGRSIGSTAEGRRNRYTANQDAKSNG